MTGDNLNADNEPTWLDEKYLLKILSAENKKDNFVTAIKSFKIQPATKTGDNYASILYLVDIEYAINQMGPNETINLSIIVKARLDSEMMTEIESEFNIFNRETQVYTKLLQPFEQLMQTIGQKIQFGPRAIYVDDKIIVLDNLKKFGYAMEDVKKGLNFEQCKMILQKLAKFHACSMVLYNEKPELFVHHLPGNLTETPTPLHLMYTNTIESCIEFCKNNSELVEFVPKLEDFAKNVIRNMINVFTRSPNDRIQALNHGDCWVNNFMFRKGYDQKLEDVLMVDYQEGFYGSIGIDLNYLIYSSIRKDVYLAHMEQLIQIYHQELSDTLCQLKYAKPIPTIVDVKQEIRNKAAHGLTTATCLLSILINEHLELADPLNFIENTDVAKANRLTIMNNPNYLQHLQLFLTNFVKDGVL